MVYHKNNLYAVFDLWKYLINLTDCMNIILYTVKVQIKTLAGLPDTDSKIH